MCRSDTSETKALQKRAFPCVARRHIFSPTVSPCLAKGKQSSLPYPLTSTKPAFTAALPFAVWRLDIKYLLFVLLSSAVGIVYIVYHNFNNYICEQTELAGKLLLPLRQGQPDGSALNGLPKPFTLPSFVHTF